MASNRPTGLGYALRDWMRPPRPHGQAIEGRTVSFLELFYDLVFVVFVSQVAHTLAAHPDWAGVRSFLVLFTLVWYTWLNGTLYHDLHGSNDGRSRTYMFVQMLLIALMSVYAGEATTDEVAGQRFAILLAILLVWLLYQWGVVRRQDDPEMAAITTPYFVGLAVILVLVVVSIPVDDPSTRLALWAVGAVSAIAIPLVAGFWHREGLRQGFVISESTAERFALFTIIVLGEVIIGVVDGLTESDSSWTTKGVGWLCLGVGFGIWWNYFDFVGRRPPRAGLANRGLWLVAHWPLSMSIAATGAAMVSVIEHATDDHTPTGTSWLVGGSMAVLCATLALIAAIVPQRPGARYVPVSLGLAALASLVVGALHPSPVVLIAALLLVLTLVWTEAFVRFARLGEPFIEEDVSA